jgi:hypothetical protein
MAGIALYRGPKPHAFHALKSHISISPVYRAKEDKARELGLPQPTGQSFGRSHSDKLRHAFVTSFGIHRPSKTRIDPSERPQGFQVRANSLIYNDM